MFYKAEACRVKKKSTAPVFQNKQKPNYIVLLLSHRKSVQIMSEDSSKSSRSLLPIEVGHMKVWTVPHLCEITFSVQTTYSHRFLPLKELFSCFTYSPLGFQFYCFQSPKNLAIGKYFEIL